jgi:hypothetical protein
MEKQAFWRRAVSAVTSALSQSQGASGTEIHAGWIHDEDHNTEWQDERVAENVDLMLKTDPLIKASMSSFKLPILAGEFQIKPASDQPIDIEIAEFVEKNLLKNDRFSWGDSVRQQLTYLDYGYSVFSKKYELREDGKFWLEKLDMRKPATIERFYPDEDGDLFQIGQFAYDWVSENFRDYRLDAPLVLLLTNERIGNNYKGVSILRSAYRSFKLKSLLMKLDAAAFERFHIGTPRGKISKSGTENELMAALASIRSHEKGYVMHSNEYEIDILRGDTQSDILQSIDYHNREMNTSLQRDFMSLGSKGEGSLALGKAQMGQFYDAIASVGSKLEDVWNHGDEKMHHIKQIVDENYPNVDEYPRLKVMPKVINKIIEVLSELGNLATAGLLTADDQTENAIRKSLDVPEIEEDGTRVRAISQGLAPQVTTEGDPQARTNVGQYSARTKKSKSRSQRVSKTVLEFEKTVMNVDGIRSRLNKSKDDLRANVGEVMDATEKSLVDAGLRIFTNADSLQDVIEKTEKFVPPGRGKLTAMVTKEGQELFDYGIDQMRRELRKQGVDLSVKSGVSDPLIEDQTEARRSIRQSVKQKTQAFFDKIMGQWKSSIISMWKAGDFSTETLRESIQRISRNRVVAELGGSLNESFGLGRNSEMVKIEKKHDVRMFRSEVLDEHICGPCIEVDGMEFSKTDPIFTSFANGPYTRCEGRDNCRGVNIVVVD